MAPISINPSESDDGNLPCALSKNHAIFIIMELQSLGYFIGLATVKKTDTSGEIEALMRQPRPVMVRPR
jgi:hypothetical protein